MGGALSLQPILTNRVDCHENNLFPREDVNGPKIDAPYDKDFTNLDGVIRGISNHMIGCEVLGSFSINNFEVKFLEEENPSEQSRLGILFCKEILKGGMVRIHYAFVHG
ncbi:hypothetical protein Tco_1015114 [Tanacetum coccineum]|uniref:Uncharacterized protein n=1 Tax=Tanacetum coccineum TaxID=301880 RepID=A0ABQ5FKX6_9ASTR